MLICSRSLALLTWRCGQVTCGSCTRRPRGSSRGTPQSSSRPPLCRPPRPQAWAQVEAWDLAAWDPAVAWDPAWLQEWDRCKSHCNALRSKQKMPSLVSKRLNLSVPLNGLGGIARLCWCLYSTVRTVWDDPLILEAQFNLLYTIMVIHDLVGL